MIRTAKETTATQGPANAAALAFQLVYALTVRELKLNYDRSFLGFIWTLASPLLRLGTLYFVFHVLLDHGGDSYAAYVFIGLLSYVWFQVSVMAGCWAVLSSPELILRPGFPRWVLPLIPVSSGAVRFILALPLAILLAWFLTGPPQLNILLFPAIIVLQVFVTIPLSFAVAALTSRYRDVHEIMQVLTLLLFFLTPIFYQRSDVPDAYQWIATINPLAYVVDAYRWALLGTPAPPIADLYFTIATTAVTLFFFIRLFIRMSNRFVEDL